jgi:hypothetical protein
MMVGMGIWAPVLCFFAGLSCPYSYKRKGFKWITIRALSRHAQPPVLQAGRMYRRLSSTTSLSAPALSVELVASLTARLQSTLPYRDRYTAHTSPSRFDVF